jgi:hypothetical protein
MIATEADVAALWLHMLDAHGVGSTMTHGDPVLMHGALNAFHLCDQVYRYAPEAPDFRAGHGSRLPPGAAR